MKLFNKITATMLTFVFVMSCFYNTVNAQEDVISLINEYLDNYALEREMTFDDTVNNKTLIDNEFMALVVKEDEKVRKEKIKNLEKKLDINIVSAKTTFTLNDYNIENDIVVVEAYEWTFFDYHGDSDFLDTSGYGVNHTLEFELKNKKLKLVEDTYNEGPLTEMKSSNFKKDPDHEPTTKEIKEYNKIVEEYERYLKKQDDEKSDEEISAKYIPGYYIYYNRGGVESYADDYVYHSANGTNYENYYNDEYKNFNSLGGDCANYVSQCIYEGGGFPMVGISNHSDNYPAWWYDNNGTPSNTSDDSYTESWAWTGAHYNRTFMKGIYGDVKDNPSSSDISKGDPLYVDWHYSGGTTWYNHTYICVGTDSDGKPIINSHNNDYYHVRWNYGYSDSKYSVVQMDDRIFIGY